MPITSIFFLMLLAGPALAGSPSLAIGTDTSALPAKLASRVQRTINKQVMDGFATAKLGLALHTDKGKSDQIRACPHAICLLDIARGESLDYAVQVTVQKGEKPGTYNILLLVAGRSQQDTWSEKIDCPGCDADEITNMVSLMCTTVGERILNAPRPPAPVTTKAEPAPVAAKIAPIAPPAPPPPMPVVSVKPEPEFYIPRLLSVATMTTGLVLVGTGIYLFHLDGEGSCTMEAGQKLCIRTYQTAGWGTGFVVGGGVLALGGLATLLFLGPKTSSPSVAFTGNGIALLGGF
jgi:hypothetical protein